MERRRPVEKPTPKPYEQFRRQREGGERMTIAMAFKCKDGLVMASDLQGTTIDGRTEPTQKIFAIEGIPRALVAFSAENDLWVKRFVEAHLTPRKKTTDPVRRIEAAHKSYLSYFQNQFPRHIPRETSFSGIYGFYNLQQKTARIFTFTDQNPPTEVLTLYLSDSDTPRPVSLLRLR
jgi:20S proteasome alpha/beta subunit